MKGFRPAPVRSIFHLQAALAAAGAALFIASCAGCDIGAVSGRLDIMSYNVENLFDDVHDGTEYREFDPQLGEWSTELFHLKMQQIADVIRAAAPGGPDIVALAEIENLNALATLNETYLKGMGYQTIASESGKTAIVVGLLSRFPVTSVRAHHASEQTFGSAGEQPRDILEARLDCNGAPLVIFVNHWKSKIGGAEATEASRRACAGIIARRAAEILAAEPSVDIIVAGDLNENWDEHLRTQDAYPTALMPAEACEGGCLALAGDRGIMRSAGRSVVFYSPWMEGTFPGSYCLAGQWESIDHTLLAATLFDGEGLEYGSFEVFRPNFLLKADGAPRGFSATSRSGYSDHLPILLHLSRKR